MTWDGDPELVAAFRRVFCGHKGQRWGHACHTAEDSALISAWVERIIERGPRSRVRPGRWAANRLPIGSAEDE